ncbi:MAG: TIR domain-containing protein [Thermoplasmata archaeon]
MAYLIAKDVRSIEDRFYELLVDAPGTKEDKQDFFLSRMNVRVPKTTYEVMWERLVDYLQRGGAGEAVFDYVLYAADPRLKELLVQASQGRKVRLHESEKAVVWDIFWENGNLRRIGEHLVGYILQTGWLQQPVRKPRTVMDMRSPYLPTPANLGLPDAFGPPMPVRQFPYDVALSYASEQRRYVRRVYNRLRKLGIETFYDEGEVVRLWGKNLESYLESVFYKMARVCVVFVSKDYVNKPWPLLEAQSALARAVQEKGEYVLPVRFDDSELPGLLPDIKYLWAKDYTPEQLADIIWKKLDEMR